jgi:hypothetical protein
MNQTLILDLLEWLAARPRPYAEVMEVWRTSCPRFTVWEDAIDNELIARCRVPGEETLIELSPCGRAFLESSGRLVRGGL